MKLNKICFVLATIFLVSCSGRKNMTPDTEFANYIKAYTGGTISERSTIKIMLVSSVREYEDRQEDIQNIFSFSPSLKGSARWAAPDIIEFVPDELKPGTSYKASFKLGKILAAAGKKTFDFSFQVMPKKAVLEVDDIIISAVSANSASVSGRVSFSDDISAEAVKEMLSCTYRDSGAAIELREGDKQYEYVFTIEPLALEDKDRILEIVLDGRSRGYREKIARQVTVPRRDCFRIIDSKLFNGRDPYIKITFSQPLAADLTPEGIFEVNAEGVYYQMEDNIAKVFFRSMQGDSIKLSVSSLARSFNDSRLEENYEKEFVREGRKPAVAIPMKGNILPDAGNLVLPFRSVNLSAVDVSVIKIYENNILMFLQDNDLSESSSLRRSGRLIYKNTVRLDSDMEKDLHEWNDFSIDLSGLFRQEPGAIYRIRLSFKQEYSLYGKEELPAGDDKMINLASGDMTKEEETVWDSPYPYYYEDFYDWSLYDWTEADDPEKPSYYMKSERFPVCNLMTTNIGIIVKSASPEKLRVAVNDILSTAPLSGAEVTAYNYQLQEIGKATTDDNGFADISVSGKAFAVTASDGKSTAYLKVNDGNENSLSRFDTGGKVIEDGIKGFVYGERGVWRPGDTLHVSVMLEDREGKLPDNHPVTVEVYTPAGQFYDRQVSTNGEGGLYVFDIATCSDDPTGIWNAYFKVGGATFHKALRVESIKPNRLKIELKVSESIIPAGKPVKMELQSSWLTGPAASGLEASVEMALSKGKTKFEKYENYIFENPASKFTSSSVRICEGRLDDKGRMSASVTVPKNSEAPGMLNASLICRVTEPGGDQSIRSETMVFSPFDAYTGVLLPSGEDGCVLTDTDHTIKAVSVDRNGNPVTGHRLEYRIYKMNWSWWWESRSSELDSYINGTSAQALASGTVVSGKEASEIPFRVDYPEWGRYFIYVKDIDGGHAAGGIIYMDWPLWRGRSGKTNPDALTMLTFSTDKKSYDTGEEATVFIPAAKNGRALVSFENGRGVISQQWVETGESEDTPYKFVITPEMAPNFYIHITLLQPHGRTGNDLPVRMYGVQPVFVNNNGSHLYPEITVPEVIRPQEEFTVAVKEKKGREMAYTLAIVDEGLLDLTSFKTPDPWSEMYAREALGVRTWDLYDNVVGAYSGRFSPMFSIGGDESVISNNRKDNRFNPVVKFLGPFKLEKGRTDRHKITLPMYIGSVRIMVVAGCSGAYGNASETVAVRSPLMVLSSFPRIAGTGETIQVPVNVFALENGVKNVDVRISAEGPLAIKGAERQSVEFASAGDKLIRFGVATKDETGKGKIVIEASGNGFSAREEISFEIRNPNPPVMNSVSKTIMPGKTETFEYAPFRAASGCMGRLEVSGLPLANVNEYFEYMMSYPHSCTEQLSAKGLVLVYLKHLLSGENAAEADAEIPEILKSLYSRQLPNGGFSYWPGSAHADEWISSMAGQLMTEASLKGYEVNKGVYNAWLKFQKQCVRNYKENANTGDADLIQAYRLYTLALASAPENGAMNRMKENPALQPAAKWRLAAAYALTGRKNISGEIISGISPAANKEYTGTNPTFGSRTRDLAMCLETLVLTEDMDEAVNLAKKIAEEFNGRRYTTQSSAFAAAAIGRLSSKLTSGALKLQISEGGAKPAVENTSNVVYTKNLDTSTGKVSVTNMSDGPVYAACITRSRAESDRPSSNGLSVSVKYTDMAGSEVTPAMVRQGTDITACVTVKNNSGIDLCNLALTHAAPSGWEIFNDRLFNGGQDPGCTYMDIRDDRVMYYFDLPAARSITFKTRFNAAYEGSFTLPAISCQAMYDSSVYANTASETSVVTR